jgi:hypothetical protein
MVVAGVAGEATAVAGAAAESGVAEAGWRR